MIAGVQLVQALSDLVDGRIYPLVATEHDSKDAPYIIYQTISVQPENTMDGFTGHEWAHMQIDVYHTDMYQCKLLTNKVIATINKQIKPSIYGGINEFYDSAANLYRTAIDYEFWQTTPTQ